MMSEPQLTSEGVESPDRSRTASFWIRQAPFLAVLALAIFGVAYTNFSGHSLKGFWEFLAVAMGFVSFAAGWPRAPDRQARLQLAWTQAAHWAAILVAMNIMLMPSFQQWLPQPATGMVLLILLAVGTFLAGIHLLSLQVCFLGLAMALSIPAMTWLKQASLLLLLAGVAVAGLVIAFWPRGSKRAA
jgi:hypothetical protein